MAHGSRRAKSYPERAPPEKHGQHRPHQSDEQTVGGKETSLGKKIQDRQRQERQRRQYADQVENFALAAHRITLRVCCSIHYRLVPVAQALACGLFGSI